MLMDNIEVRHEGHVRRRHTLTPPAKVGNRVSFLTENQVITGIVKEINVGEASGVKMQRAMCSADQTEQGGQTQAKVQVDGDRGPLRPVL